MKPTKELPRKCLFCSWWECFDEHDGACHRYAPRPRIVDEQEFFSPMRGEEVVLWPDTKATNFCGDWSPDPCGLRAEEA